MLFYFIFHFKRSKVQVNQIIPVKLSSSVADFTKEFGVLLNQIDPLNMQDVCVSELFLRALKTLNIVSYSCIQEIHEQKFHSDPMLFLNITNCLKENLPVLVKHIFIISLYYIVSFDYITYFN